MFINLIKEVDHSLLLMKDHIKMKGRINMSATPLHNLVFSQRTLGCMENLKVQLENSDSVSLSIYQRSSIQTNLILITPVKPLDLIKLTW
jgi:hypothetical protein